ncbi:hypothetical protein D6779_09700 [Candidatus Parcubacteria bacterium]|nr:MAG: hypothetical protein D6779_09700 [Candidatus Parcubacteria bacterium]
MQLQMERGREFVHVFKDAREVDAFEYAVEGNWEMVKEILRLSHDENVPYRFLEAKWLYDHGHTFTITDNAVRWLRP